MKQRQTRQKIDTKREYYTILTTNQLYWNILPGITRQLTCIWVIYNATKRLYISNELTTIAYISKELHSSTQLYKTQYDDEVKLYAGLTNYTQPPTVVAW